ncbi:helix-turn-helix domain-containing protein [Limosilactobacillus reuteri subsp. suis]|uniref:helix-turn-helix domain-containing protein n=1 Tax=Limosilactobacillus reuteri TaxID=1598 RepID=UPI0039918B53
MDNSYILKLFGNHLRILRLEKGFSQEKLADRAHVHRTYIGMIERGEKNITLLTMEKISHALNVDLCTLVTFENEDD